MNCLNCNLPMKEIAPAGDLLRWECAKCGSIHAHDATTTSIEYQVPKGRLLILMDDELSMLQDCVQNQIQDTTDYEDGEEHQPMKLEHLSLLLKKLDLCWLPTDKGDHA